MALVFVNLQCIIDWFFLALCKNWKHLYIKYSRDYTHHLHKTLKLFPKRTIECKLNVILET